MIKGSNKRVKGHWNGKIACMSKMLEFGIITVVTRVKLEMCFCGDVVLYLNKTWQYRNCTTPNDRLKCITQKLMASI